MHDRKLPVPFLLSAIVAALMAGCGPGSDSAATGDGASASMADPNVASGNKLVTVMSQNLYLGADLAPVILAQTPGEFVAATTEVWATVQANNQGETSDGGPARFEAIADEIEEERPHLVALQEVYTWEIAAPGTGDFVMAYDYLETLRAKLAARGLEYEPVAELQLFRFAAPIATGQTIRMTDHQVILARTGVHVTNAQGDVFGPDGCGSDPDCLQLLKVPVLGQAVPVPRGWTSVDVKLHGEAFRLVNTHLEAFHAGVRDLQVIELVGVLAGAAGQVVLGGDLNVRPGDGAHALFLGAGFTDAWTALHEEPDAPGEEGFTSGLPGRLWQAGVVDERIDYVLVRGEVHPMAMNVLGDRDEDRVAVGDVELWPSDHAALSATLGLVDPRSCSHLAP